ncbi:MAG: hypothetical protein Q9157_003297 [Trypethelium eluteriae]
MFGRAFLTFISFLVLLGHAVATTYYRGDSRSPTEIKNAGGFKAKDPDGDGDVLAHANNALGASDPWVSTSSDYSVGEKNGNEPGYGWVYYIDSSGLTFVDVNQAFKDQKKTNKFAVENEFAVKGEIPWDNVIKWDRLNYGAFDETETKEDFEKSQGGGTKRSVRPFVA